MTPAEKAASKLCDIWRGHYSSAAVTRIIDEAMFEQEALIVNKYESEWEILGHLLSGKNQILIIQRISQ